MKISTLTGTLILGLGSLTALSAPAQGGGNLLEHRDSGCYALFVPSNPANTSNKTD
jgi:hypothetical protein